MKKVTFCKVTFCFLLALVISVLSFNTAHTFSYLTDDFNFEYSTNGTRGGTTLGSCITCHGDGGYGSINLYGDALIGAGVLSDSVAAFRAVQIDDSDGDGVTNIDEILSGTFPGDPSSVPDTPANNSPVADAGPDQTVSVDDLVILDGSNSSDADGDALSFSWSFVSRPAGSWAALSDPASVNPDFTVDLPGTYEVQLVVHDGVADSAPDIVSISTLNSAPIADAGLDQSPVVGETVTLDGSSSSDADGDSLSFSWSFVTRPAGSSALLSDTTASQPTFTVDMAGSFIVRLIVNDGMVDSQADTVTISTENSAPVANAGNAQTVDVGARATLDGSASSDVDGDLLNFSWSFMSLPEGSQAVLSDPTAVMPSFLVDLPGTYVVQLIVNDGWVGSTPDTVSITTENSAPSASAGPNKTVPVGSTVLLDGSTSSDPDGNQLKYSWSLVSIPPESAATLSDPTDVAPSFYVDSPGTYVAQLMVSDGLLESIPDTVTISTDNSAPTAEAGKRMRARIGDTVTLNGSNSSDLDGDPLNFSWSFVSLPEGSTANLSDPAASMPYFVADLPGVYIVQLIVNDGTVDSAPDNCIIRVRSGGKPYRDGKPGKGNGSGNNSEPN